jgi:hypothetical protein
VSLDAAKFILARRAEDEATVRAVLGITVMARVQRGLPAPRWVPSPRDSAGVHDTDGIPRVRLVWPREREHIIRHDPARVLDDVTADRALVDAYTRHWQACSAIAAARFKHEDGSSRVDEWIHHDTAVRALTPHVLARAARWKDHPDYQPKWAPDAGQ